MTAKRRTLKLLKEQIEQSAHITDQDRQNLLAFDDRMALLKTEYSVSRREKHLRACAIMAGQSHRIAQDQLPNIDLSAVLDNRDAAEKMVRWINDRYENEETNRDYRIALRIFGKRVTAGDSIPQSLEWIPTTTSRNYQPQPDPAQMLRWEEDVLPIIEIASTRATALIAVAWDAGARAGESLNLTVGSVSDHEHGLQITVDGKRGQRTITLIPSVPYLNRWLADHPARHNRTAPLWCKQDGVERPSEQAIWKQLRNLATEAGVTKPVTLTNFRKSSASHLASQNLNQAHLEDRYGWTRGSTVASRYVAVFGGESDSQLAKIHGLTVDEETPDPIAPLICPRCEKKTPREENFCVWCHQALSPEAIPNLQGYEDKVRRAVLRLVREDSEALDTIERAQQLMKAFDVHSGLHQDVRRFEAMLDDQEDKQKE